MNSFRFFGPAIFIGFVGAVLAIPAPAEAQCLTGGDINICEDPVTGEWPGATVSGGTMLAGEGFRIDAKGDFITYDLGEFISAASVRFKVRGISNEALDADTHIVMLITDVPEINPPPPHLLEMKIWGSAVDPTAVGTLGVGPCDPSDETIKRIQLPWDGSEYLFDLSFDNETQRVRVDRNGETVIDFMTGDLIPGPDNPPIVMHYRYVHLSMPCCLNNPAFQPVIGSVYTMFSIAAVSEEPAVADEEELEPEPEDSPAMEEAVPEEPGAGDVPDLVEATDPEVPEPGEPDADQPDGGLSAATGGCACSAGNFPDPRPVSVLFVLLLSMLSLRRRSRKLS